MRTDYRDVGSFLTTHRFALVTQRELEDCPVS